MTIWDDFKKKKREVIREGTRKCSKPEFERYLEEEEDDDEVTQAVVGSEDDQYKFDILGWWSRSGMRYPVLSHMARDILVVPVSTVASESAFSTGGRVLDSFRISLSPEVVEALICCEDWIISSDSELVADEDDSDDQVVYQTLFAIFQARSAHASISRSSDDSGEDDEIYEIIESDEME